MAGIMWRMEDNFGRVICPEGCYTSNEIIHEKWKIEQKGYAIQCSYATRPCNYTVVRKKREDEKTISFLVTDFLHMLSHRELLTLLMILTGRITEFSPHYLPGYEHIMTFLKEQQYMPRFDLEDRLIADIREVIRGE